MSASLKLTIAEFDRMIERGEFDHSKKRVELIHGELREMSPVGPAHDDIISFLNRWSCSCTQDDVGIRVQCSVELPELESVPQPDIAWVRRGRYRQRRPQPEDVLLVIEVAASSLKYDLGKKQLLYAAAGVVEYWVVDVRGECIHTFRHPTKKGFRTTKTYGRSQTLAPAAAPKANLDLAKLFTR